eukprot:scaffold26325_cov20-Cyclotella_meneghiniana.AAC.1
MTVEDLICLFKDQIEVCIPHIQEIRWISHFRKTKFAVLPPTSIMIFTDFAALMCLRAFEAKNSSVDAHAICATFVVMYNRRFVTLKKKIGECETVFQHELFNVDVHHFFAETLEKGKKNDHAMHNTCLKAIIPHYQQILRDLHNVELNHVIICTDNCPNQYRCRQTFLPIAAAALHFPGITIEHILAVKDNFKG